MKFAAHNTLFLTLCFVACNGAEESQQNSGLNSQFQGRGSSSAFVQLLDRHGDKVCEGTIVKNNPLLIVTAAHCENDFRSLRLSTGEVISGSFHPHPSYQGPACEGFDIAVISTSESANVVPVTLPIKAASTGTMIFTTAQGSEKMSIDIGYVQSETASGTACTLPGQAIVPATDLPKNTGYATEVDSTSSPKKSNSGGGLLLGPRLSYVVSFEAFDEASGEPIGVYTAVEPYVNWIESVSKNTSTIERKDTIKKPLESKEENSQADPGATIDLCGEDNILGNC